MKRLKPEQVEHIRSELADLTDVEKRLAAVFLLGVRNKPELAQQLLSQMTLEEYKAAFNAARLTYQQAWYRAAQDTSRDQRPNTI